MSEYRKVEIRKPGEELTMRVEKVFFNPKTDKHKYPDFTFQGENQDGKVMLYMPENSCRRQFGRSPLTMEPEAAVGAVIRFYRDENKEDPSKPYWSVEMVGGQALTSAPTKRLAPPTTVPGDTPERYKGKPATTAPDWSDVPAPDAPTPEDYPVRAAAGQPSGKAGSWDALVQQMGQAYRASVDIQGDRGDAASYQAMCATFIIQADKRGIVIPTITLAQAAKELDLEMGPEAGDGIPF